MPWPLPCCPFRAPHLPHTTVTTKDAVQGGDVVTVKGFLHLNRDFGAGYVYPVIIEDAKIVR